MKWTCPLVAVLVLLTGFGLTGCPPPAPCEEEGLCLSPTPTAGLDRDGDGYSPEDQDCDDDNSAVYPNATEVCNEKDDDCDGETDEGVASSFYLDGDGDGHGTPDVTTLACQAPANTVTLGDDCDDGDKDVHPDAEETCDGIDNDCDGLADDADPDIVGGPTWYIDYDGDSYGSSRYSVTVCLAPEGYADSENDCDDWEASVYPGALELCDGLDNDCDEKIDEGVTSTYFVDADGDGHGSLTTVEACELADGLSGLDDDCNDADPASYPGAQEICDNGGSAPLDNDCDGEVDEGLETFPVYPDEDGDGFGAGEGSSSCGLATGQARIGGDCDDTRPEVNPLASEQCDDLDNDCDGEVDEVCFGTASFGKSRWSKRPEDDNEN